VDLNHKQLNSIAVRAGILTNARHEE
jgi:hypothetical protein